MIHAELFGMLYDWGQKDIKVGLIMFPLMAHIKAAVKKGIITETGGKV